MAKMFPPGTAKGGDPALVVAVGAPKAGRMAPPGTPDGSGGSGKVSPEEAGAVRVDSHCIDCKNYDPQQGMCSKVDGQWDPQDGCVKYFEAAEGDEPDEDDQGGPSDQDSDDMPGPPGADA